jgi:hypothetical protein
LPLTERERAELERLCHEASVTLEACYNAGGRAWAERADADPVSRQVFAWTVSLFEALCGVDRVARELRGGK